MAFVSRTVALHASRAGRRRARLVRVVEAIEASATTRTESDTTEYDATLSRVRDTQLDNAIDRLQKGMTHE